MKNLNDLTRKSYLDNQNASTDQNQNRGFLHDDKTKLRIPANRQELSLEPSTAFCLYGCTILGKHSILDKHKTTS